MFRKALLILTLAALPLTLTNTSSMAQEAHPHAQQKQQKKQSPFLINDRLPHLTKLLIKQWDNPNLNLTQAQKEQLLLVRRETMTGVRTLGPKISTLEQQVVAGINMGKTPGELKQTVAAIAKLKAEATMIHLKCIHQTSAILTKQQLARLTAK